MDLASISGAVDSSVVLSRNRIGLKVYLPPRRPKTSLRLVRDVLRTYNVCTSSEMTTARKERRINLRASERDVKAITRASALAGVSVSAFILISATERAERALADLKHFELNPKQWRAFTAALDRPARKLPRLRRLLQEPSILDRQ